MYIENGLVYKTKQTKKSVVKLFYDMQFHTKLVYENGLIVASVYDYQNNFISDFNSIILFELEGQMIESQAIEGKASIEFTSEITGKYLVKTIVEGFRNGVLEIEIQ